MRLIGIVTVLLAVALLTSTTPALAADPEVRVAENLIITPASHTASTYFAPASVLPGGIPTLDDRGVR